jgi:hypothetical protein
MSGFVIAPVALGELDEIWDYSFGQRRHSHPAVRRMISRRVVCG